MASSEAENGSHLVNTNCQYGEPDDAGEFYDHPLDDAGIDLFEIPEDFDKAEGTILRRERIETRWKRSVILVVLHLSRSLLMELKVL